MTHAEDSETPTRAQQQQDPTPFDRRCDELGDMWDGLREDSQNAGNRASFADVVTRIAGLAFAEKFIGDAVMALFGAPKAR